MNKILIFIFTGLIVFISITAIIIMCRYGNVDPEEWSTSIRSKESAKSSLSIENNINIDNSDSDDELIQII